jgi:hypothetical protein
MHKIMLMLIILTISFSIIHIALIVNQLYILVFGIFLTIICLNVSIHIIGEKYKLFRLLYIVLSITPIITGILVNNFLQGLITVILLELSVIMCFIMYTKKPLAIVPISTLQEDTITEPLPAYLPKCPSYISIV